MNLLLFSSLHTTYFLSVTHASFTQFSHIPGLCSRLSLDPCITYTFLRAIGEWQPNANSFIPSRISAHSLICSPNCVSRLDNGCPLYLSLGTRRHRLLWKPHFLTRPLYFRLKMFSKVKTLTPYPIPMLLSSTKNAYEKSYFIKHIFPCHSPQDSSWLSALPTEPYPSLILGK